MVSLLDRIKTLLGLRKVHKIYFFERQDPEEWENSPRILRCIYTFNLTIPIYRNYAPFFAFTGKAAKEKLAEVAGEDADYLEAFLLIQGMLKTVDLKNTDVIVPNESTLYRICHTTMPRKIREIIDGGFPEEVAHMERNQ